jgi:putative ABC transport system permease protein
MKCLRALLIRLMNLFHSDRNERDLNEEIEAHLVLHIEDNLRSGMTPEAARREALLKLGGIGSTKEICRDRQGVPFLDHLWRDLRYSLRQLRRTPGFTLTAVGALALGIGATTAVFSLVNAMLLRPVPVPDPDRLVLLVTTESDAGEGESAGASPSRFAHWRSQSSVFQDVAALDRAPAALGFADGATGAGQEPALGQEIEQWQGRRASFEVFRCLGVRILQGRTFTPAEDLPGGANVAVISQSLWARRFANDPQIVGKQVSLNRDSYTIIGVVTDSPVLLALGNRSTDVFLPFQLDPNTQDHGQFFNVVARLKPGISLDQANAELQVSVSVFRAKFPDVLGPKSSFRAVPFREAMVRISGTRPLLFVLLGAVTLVLLIACANVANLLLVRASGRKHEIGIRLAIGAGRGRVIRQLLTECVVLSLAGGALGLSLGDAAIRALLAANQTDLRIAGTVDLDWRVLGFSFVLSLLTAIIFGLLPALQSSRVDLNTVLKTSSGRWSTALRHNKAHATFVVSEVSLALILLIGSALLIRTFVALYEVDRGFATRNVVAMELPLVGPKYEETADMARAIRAAVDGIRVLPGVASVGATAFVPLEGSATLPFDFAGGGQSAALDTQAAGWSIVSPGFFETFQISVKRGRVFTERDDNKSPAVVVINERMAKEFWKDRDPLDDRIVIGHDIMPSLKGEPERQIIGIVGDVRDQGLNADPRPIMYVPQAQLPNAQNAFFIAQGGIDVVVRTQSESSGLMRTIREELRRVTGVPVGETRSMDNVVAISAGQQRFNMLLMSVFGAAALLLAAIGIYGLMAYTVKQRTQEIGIRLALGADAAQVRNMVMRQGLGLALAGVTIGLGAAWVLSRVLEGILFGVKARDPIVFAIVPLLLSAVALLAVWIPARRALHVDPAAALRYE